MASFIGLTSIVVACGGTPEPTEPPATPAPRIIILTPTPMPEGTAPTRPTQTQVAIPEAPTATVAAPGTTASPTAVVEPTETGAVPATVEPSPTAAPVAAVSKYPPPAPLDPPSDRLVEWRDSLTLIWEPVGELEEDEFYAVKLERRPRTETQEWWSGEAFLKATEYVLEGSFLAPFHYSAEHGDATVYWWVRVVRVTGEDSDGKPVGIDISEKSEERTLILNPKPEGG